MLYNSWTAILHDRKVSFTRIQGRKLTCRAKTMTTHVHFLNICKVLLCPAGSAGEHTPRDNGNFRTELLRCLYEMRNYELILSKNARTCFCVCEHYRTCLFVGESIFLRLSMAAGVFFFKKKCFFLVCAWPQALLLWKKCTFWVWAWPEAVFVEKHFFCACVCMAAGGFCF